MMKEPSFETPRRVLTCLLILSLQTTAIGVFPDYFSFNQFLAASFSFCKKGTTFIKFCPKFHVKQAKFLLSKCTSLILRSKLVQQNCLHFFKNFKNSVRSKG